MIWFGVVIVLGLAALLYLLEALVVSGDETRRAVLKASVAIAIGYLVVRAGVLPDIDLGFKLERREIRVEDLVQQAP